MGISTEQTCHYRCAEFCWFLVLNIKYRWHFVTILCFESTSREQNGWYHVGIYETKSLLLSRTDKLRTVNLYIVHEDKILVKVTATHIVLRTKFIVGCHRWQSLKYVLETACGWYLHWNLRIKSCSRDMPFACCTNIGSWKHDRALCKDCSNLLAFICFQIYFLRKRLVT